MDLENALRTMFPQIDARLIKAIVLDGDDMESAMDFLIKEGTESYEKKPNGISSPASNCVHVNDILIMPDAKKHQVNQDEENLTDFDKHEESIVWKGGCKSNGPLSAQNIYSDQGQGIDDFYDSNCQGEEAFSPGQQINWWATTWPNVAGSKSDGDMYNSSNSSLHTDYDTQETAGTLSWGDMEQFKSIQQKIYLQGGPNVDFSSTGSTQSLTLEKESTSLWSPARGSNMIEKCGNSLAEFGLPLSQDSFKIFNSEALELNMLEAERSFSRSNDKYCQPSISYISDGNSNISSSQCIDVRSVWEDNLVQENAHESSRHNINTEDLDKFVNEAKCCKDNLRKDMEDIYLLRQKAEQEELAAQHAKTEAASSGLELFLKVEDIRQQMSRQRAEYEMRAAEVYGEKSVLAMEARELKVRLLETQAEQAKALSLLDSIRCSLSARLEKASQEKQYAVEETKMKVKNAEELLASEQASAQKLEESFKVLEAEAETCKKLREFLIERGNIVDSLQGEMAVLCEDVLAFKQQVDEGIPLSAGSRSLSWSRMSHLTEQLLLTSPPGDVKDCGASRCTPLGSSACLNSMSSISLSSATSELPKSVRPIECALHSQYFSPGTSMVDTANQGLNGEVIKEKMTDGQEAGEEISESLVTIVRQVCNDGEWGKQDKEEKFHAPSSCECSLEEVSVL